MQNTILEPYCVLHLFLYERGFDIRIDAEHNKVLVNDIRNYLLPRKLQDRVDNTNYEFLL